MKIILTGATGYVGEGVLLACLADPRVEKVLSIGRRACGHSHAKLEEYIVDDMMQIAIGDTRLQGYDAVFFCAGISSVGMSEAQYRPISHDIPMRLAQAIEPRDRVSYIYVSGAGTGSSRQMWGRVKRQTEDELQQMGFRQVFNFRPAIMKPMPMQLHLKRMDRILARMFWLAKLIGQGNTLEAVQRAMMAATLYGYHTPTIEVKDIAALARRT